MNFAAIAIGAGIAGALLVAYLQGPPLPVTAQIQNTTVIDPTATASIKPAAGSGVGTLAKASGALPDAMRLIDLRSGATCRIVNPGDLGPGFTPAPIGPDCAGSPELDQVSQWRTGPNGALEMADSDGQMILRFMPGDGVLYESIYPATAMVTIVPAKG